MIIDWLYGPSGPTTSQIWVRTPFTTGSPRVSTLTSINDAPLVFRYQCQLKLCV